MRPTLAVAVVTIALLATGCSSEASGGSGGSSAGAAAKSSPTSPSTSPAGPMSPSSSMSGSASSSPAEQGNTIIIKAYKYSGATSVKAGSTVIVRNDDSVAHTVTADKGGAWDLVVPGGASRTFTAPTSGTYPYHCLFHGNMHGTLRVR